MSEVAAPGYWMHETSGVLRPAIEAYLCQDLILIVGKHHRDPRLPQAMGLHRPCGKDPGVEHLRARVDGLTTRRAIDAWLADALDAGIDPL